MSDFKILGYILMVIPILFLFFSILFVMGQGKKNFLSLVKNGTSRLKKKIVFVLIFTILFSGVYLFSEQGEISTHSAAVIGINYQEASRGLNPNKTRFNVSDILSDEVLERAIAEGNFNNVSIDDLKKGLSVTPVNAGNTLSLENSYMSTEYLLTYETSWNTKHLSPVTVVDMVAHAYYEEFIEDYSRKMDLLELDYSQFADLDYLDINRVFDGKSQSLQNYATNLSYENASFQSENTGETFSSIAEKVGTFRDVQLERFEAYILTHGVAKNKNQYIAKLNYDNKITSLAYMKNEATHEVNLETIDLYERDMARIVLVPSEDVDGKYYMSRTKIGVDYFADKAEKAMQQAADLQLKIDTNNYAIDQMLGATATETQIEKTEAMLSELEADYTNLVDTMVQTLKDYDNKTTNGYISIQINSKTKIGNYEVKKSIVLGAIFMFSLMILIIVFPSSGNVVIYSTGKKERKTKVKRIKRQTRGDKENR